MCWLSIERPAMMVAEENIPIFKLVEAKDDKFISPFYDFEYKVNEEYSMDTVNVREIYSKPLVWTINKGFHSYGVINRVINGHVLTPSGKSIGYYNETRVKVVGYIPIGATYCKNSKNEYVSNKIVITGIEQ